MPASEKTLVLLITATIHKRNILIFPGLIQRIALIKDTISVVALQFHFQSRKLWVAFVHCVTLTEIAQFIVVPNFVDNQIQMRANNCFKIPD